MQYYENYYHVDGEDGYDDAVVWLKIIFYSFFLSSHLCIHVIIFSNRKVKCLLCFMYTFTARGYFSLESE